MRSALGLWSVCVRVRVGVLAIVMVSVKVMHTKIIHAHERSGGGS